MSLTLLDEREPDLHGVAFDSTNTPGALGVFAIDNLSRRVDEIYLTNSDAVDHVIEFQINDATHIYYAGSVNVPAGQGFAGTAPLALFNQGFTGYLSGISVPPGWNLALNCPIAVGAGQSVSASAVGGLL